MRTLSFLCSLAISMLLISPDSTAQTLPAYLPSNGLVAWYPFNGNTNDESGNGNDLTNSGALLSNGLGNTAQGAFEMTSGYLISQSDNFNSSAFSFSAWVKPEQSTNSLGNIGGNYAAHQGYFIGLTYGIPHVRIHGGMTDLTVVSSQSLSIGGWNHLVVKYDSQFLRLYVNGLMMAEASTSNFSFENRPTMIIGRAPWMLNDPGTSFPGTIDEVAIYNRALTQEEITALYTGTPVNNNGGNTTSNAVPPGIPYQAVVRNASGQVAANTAATTKFTLHQNTTDGAVEYQETHALTTNAQGLVSAVIGQGTAVQGTFAGINWSNTTKFLQVEVDLGNGYVDLGTQQLMSVPFALYAAYAPAGPEGPAGQQGPAGADGANGATGPQGPAGNDGQDASLSVSLTGDTLYTGTGFIIVPGISQANYVYGCTESNSCNYNSQAVVNDGSCIPLGLSCDDGNDFTVNDIIGNDCLCHGTPLSIGDAYQGGVVAYILQPGDPGYIQNQYHGLITTTVDYGPAAWGCYLTDLPGPNESFAIGTGQANTTSIVTNCNIAGIAAAICNDLVLNGYDDWYLPSGDELLKLKLNQTAIGNFNTPWYWSSTEIDYRDGWKIHFGLFTQDYGYAKYNLNGVRPVRSF